MHEKWLFVHETHLFYCDGLIICILRFTTFFFSYFIIFSGGGILEDELTFGSRLCQLRKKNGITQRDLAQKLGVHITTIKNWEWTYWRHAKVRNDETAC